MTHEVDFLVRFLGELMTPKKISKCTEMTIDSKFSAIYHHVTSELQKNDENIANSVFHYFWCCDVAHIVHTRSDDSGQFV